jgi:sulfur-oxidizing protein SoxY
MKRRTFLKGSLAAGTVGVAVSAGLLTPSSVLAAWPKDAMEAKGMDDALKATGMAGASDSKDIKIKAPDIAENGAVVPVTVDSNIAGATTMAIFAKENGSPLTSSYDLGKGTEAYISTRIKMGKTSDIIAVVKAGDKSYMSSKNVKVTIGGCGG